MVTGALARLWTDRCSIFVREGFENPETGRTAFRERPLWEDLPCRVSYTGVFPVTGNLSAGRQRVKNSLLHLGGAPVRGSVKLFIGPDREIPPGSRVVVTRQGRETAYHLSGAPAVYASHTEAPLELEQAWA